MISSFVSAKPPLAHLAAQRVWLHIVVVLMGSWALAASSYVSVPMIPVPMTMQTFALCAIAGLAGMTLSVEIVAAWLMQAAVGWPVLAGGAGGLAPFVGPTGGYMVGFLLAAALVGWARDAGLTRGAIRLGGWFLIGHALIIALGWVWLSHLIGPSKAFSGGVAPFVIGSVLKSALAAASLLIVEPALARARGD